ncbi:MAG: hypothetical protein K2P21_06820 [Lachnospiraceae bacterium]|nr:hypothetical protein [Lachnospiraceae bacterium]
MANRKMRCNKTKMKMMRLVGEVLEKKMPSKYQEFQMLGMKDTEYSQLGRYGHYELEFYLGMIVLPVCWMFSARSPSSVS